MLYSRMNFQNKRKLCREKYAARKLNFTEQKAKLLFHAKNYFSTRHLDISSVFKLISIYIITDLLTFLPENVEIEATFCGCRGK